MELQRSVSGGGQDRLKRSLMYSGSHPEAVLGLGAVATCGLAGSTGLTRANRGGMALVHLERIAGVVAVDRERRNQDCAADTDGVHRGDHLVTRDLARSRQFGVPRPARVIALVGMHLRVDGQHILALPLSAHDRRGSARLHSRYLLLDYSQSIEQTYSGTDLHPPRPVRQSDVESGPASRMRRFPRSRLKTVVATWPLDRGPNQRS